MIDDANWSIHYFIVDTRNWWFGTRVLMSPLAVKTIDWFDRHVGLNVSRELVKAGPPWDPLVAFNDEYAKRLHTHLWVARITGLVRRFQSSNHIKRRCRVYRTKYGRQGVG